MEIIEKSRSELSKQKEELLSIQSKIEHHDFFVDSPRNRTH